MLRAMAYAAQIALGALLLGLTTLSLQLEYTADDVNWLGAPFMALLGGVLGFLAASLGPRTARGPAGTAWGLTCAVALAFAAQHALGAVQEGFVPLHMGLVKAGALAPGLVRDGALWRIGTAPLIFGGTVHALLSLGALWMAARQLRTRMPAVIVVLAALAPALLAAAVVAALVPGGLHAAGSAPAWALTGGLLVAERRAHHGGASGTPRWWWWGVLGGLLLLTAVTPHAHGGVQVLAAGLGAGLLALEGRRPREGASLGAKLGLGATLILISSSAAFAVKNAQREDAAHAETLLALVPSLGDPNRLNSAAWKIAIDAQAEPWDLALARGLSERSLELEPEASAFLDTLATLQYRVGELAEAASTELSAAARAYNPFFWGQLQRFLRAYRSKTGEVLVSGGHGPASVGFDRVGWGLVMWWPRGSAPTVVLEVRGEDAEPLGSVLAVSTGTTAGSHRFSLPEELGSHLSEGAKLEITWVREPHPDWGPGLLYFPHDPEPSTLP